MAAVIRALQGWGWLLALGIALAAFALAWAGLNPVEEANDHLAAPVGRSVGILESRCPGSWQDTTDKDIHTRVISCSKDGWLVILNPDGDFDHALQLDTPGAVIVFDESQVPGWK